MKMTFPVTLTIRPTNTPAVLRLAEAAEEQAVAWTITCDSCGGQLVPYDGPRLRLRHRRGDGRGCPMASQARAARVTSTARLPRAA